MHRSINNKDKSCRLGQYIIHQRFVCMRCIMGHHSQRILALQSIHYVASGGSVTKPAPCYSTRFPEIASSKHGYQSSVTYARPEGRGRASSLSLFVLIIFLSLTLSINVILTLHLPLRRPYMQFKL
ncbi:hypothetical protein BDR07DRAFT_432153 [Suillus spraguei]|nr:hypothetical protein BDR07DRAFT_432153 [Suillus spraguei]